MNDTEDELRFWQAYLLKYECLLSEEEQSRVKALIARASQQLLEEQAVSTTGFQNLKH